MERHVCDHDDGGEQISASRVGREILSLAICVRDDTAHNVPRSLAFPARCRRRRPHSTYGAVELLKHIVRLQKHLWPDRVLIGRGDCMASRRYATGAAPTPTTRIKDRIVLPEIGSGSGRSRQRLRVLLANENGGQPRKVEICIMKLISDTKIPSV